MLQPEAREQLLHLATAPPFVHMAHEDGMVGVDRVAEPDIDRGRASRGRDSLVAHRALTQAVSAAKTAWIGTRIPKTSPRYSGNGRTPPSVRA